MYGFRTSSQAWRSSSWCCFRRRAISRRRGRWPRVSMLGPVVEGFGQYRNHVLHLFFYLESRPDGKQQHSSLASRADILHENSSQEPERHLLIMALHANPAGLFDAHDRQVADQAQAALDFGDDACIVGGMGAHLLW